MNEYYNEKTELDHDVDELLTDSDFPHEQTEEMGVPEKKLSEDSICTYAVHKKKLNPGIKAFLWIFGTVLSFAVVFFSSSVAVAHLKNSRGFWPFYGNSINSGVANLSGPILDTKDHTETEGTLTAEAIYKKVAPSIVGVITYNPKQGLVSSSAGQGSGIIMSSDGYIITNAHVIGNSNKYNVTVVRDEKEYPAKIVGFDTRVDLAILKINANGLTPAEFGNSDQLSVGEWVLAIGNPGGLENSLTRGLVSALNRSIGSNSPVKFIQTDAAINPGNSGGALLNMYGQVIGINSCKLVDYERLGFAIPVNTAKSVVDDIINKGYVSGRVRLGVSVRQISAYEAQLNDVPQGVLIVEINEDSKVTVAGVRIGDIITKIDGVSTPTTSALFTELSKHSPNDMVTLTVFRTSLIGAQSYSFDTKVSLLEDKGQIQ